MAFKHLVSILFASVDFLSGENLSIFFFFAEKCVDSLSHCVLYCGAYLLAFVVCSNLYFNVVKPIDINRYIIHVRGKKHVFFIDLSTLSKEAFSLHAGLFYKQNLPNNFSSFWKGGGIFFQSKNWFLSRMQIFFALLFKMFNFSVCIVTGDI